MQKQKSKIIEEAMPAPDDDWGTGICDLNVQELEKQLEKLERGKTMKEDTKARNRKTIYRFVQGLVIGSLITGVLFYKYTADEHQQMHDLLDEQGITMPGHEIDH